MRVKGLYKLVFPLLLCLSVVAFQSCKSLPKTKRKYAAIHVWPKESLKVIIVAAPEREDNRLSLLYGLTANNSLIVKEKVIQSGITYLNQLLTEDSSDGQQFTPILLDTIRFSLVNKPQNEIDDFLKTHQADAIISLENYVITQKEVVKKVGDTEQIQSQDWINVHWTMATKNSVSNMTDTLTQNMKTIGSGSTLNIKGLEFESKQAQGLIKYNARELYNRFLPWEDDVFRRYYLQGSKLLTTAKKELKNGNIDAALNLIMAQINESTEKLSKIDPNNVRNDQKGLLITEGEKLARTYHDYAVCLELKGDLENAKQYAQLALSFFNEVPSITLHEIDYIDELTVLIKHQELREKQLQE